MITLTKSGNTIKFTFQNNGHYLANGTIEVPVNSLILVADDSEMATFKKAASNDIFISAFYSDLGMSRAQLISWWQANAVRDYGTTAAEVQAMIDSAIASGASGVSSAEVQSMIDSSTVDFFDDAKYVSSSQTINFYHGNTFKIAIDASDFIIDGMVDDVRIENGYLIIDFNTASGKQDIQIPISDIFDASNYYTKAEVDAIASAKTDNSDFNAYTANTKNLINAKLDSSAFTEYTAATDVVIAAKADYSAVTLADTQLQTNIDNEASARTSADTALQNAIDAEASARTEADSTLDGKIMGVSAITSAHTSDDTIHFTTGTVQSLIDSSISGKVDNSTYTAYTAATEAVLSGKMDTSAYTPIEVSSAITENDTNPVEGGVLYDELRINNSSEVTLEWTCGDIDSCTTNNYPSGGTCSKIQFEVVENGDGWTQNEVGFDFHRSSGESGWIHLEVSNGVITVDNYGGVTYSINGNIVTVEYQSIAANVEYIYCGYENHWTVKAIVGDVIPLIDQVSANTISLANKVETSAITSAVTSASTDNEIPTAKAVYDAIPTGGTGAAYSAGTGIAIDSANTISLDVPISGSMNDGNSIPLKFGTSLSVAGSGCVAIGKRARLDNGRNNIIISVPGSTSADLTAVRGDYVITIGSSVTVTGSPVGTSSIAIGNGTYVNGGHSNAIGIGCRITGDTSTAIGRASTVSGNSSVAIGNQAKTSGDSSVAIGSGATANGTDYKMNLNNQILVTPTNQVYISNSANTSTYCVQTKIEGLEATIGDINTILSSI